MADPYSPPLDRERHLRYWTRCVRSLLPHHYTSNDGNRMALGYFILSAVDLLTPPSSTTDPAAKGAPTPSSLLSTTDRSLLRQWILACRYPGGGFVGSPSLALPAPACEGWDFTTRTTAPAHPELASLPATCFAVILLAILADDESANSAFEGVDRVGTLKWLRRLQREDGSFGETLAEVERKGEGHANFVTGGKDMRYCYLAALLRWALRGDVQEGDAGWVEDIDVQGLVRYIGRSQVSAKMPGTSSPIRDYIDPKTQTYDGGIAESSQHEPHGKSFGNAPSPTSLKMQQVTLCRQLGTPIAPLVPCHSLIGPSKMARPHTGARLSGRPLPIFHRSPIG